MKNFYITTTLPYVNAEPHIGFALEIVQADVLARHHRTIGDEVFFNTGTDEHGLKVYRQAKEKGKTPLEFASQCTQKFNDLKKALNLSYNNFIRTSDKDHKQAAQEFWKKCLKNGDIYKGKQKIKYCVGCELEKTKSELIDGYCPIHPNLKIETLEEENYFFRFSKYQKSLLKLYQENPKFVIPDYRLKEIETFVKGGLTDFSVSRLKSKLPWGVAVPNDPDHVQFVWFDALVNYISAIGWPTDLKKFRTWWPVIQTAGKDNLRQQSAMWQAMLMSAGLPPSKQIFIHGFIGSEGKKMSKSLGNVVDPFKEVKKYGTDPTRYYLLGEIPAYDDGDYSESRFVEVYNADLANGLGNLVARVAKLCEKSGFDFPKDSKNHQIYPQVRKALDEFRFDEALAFIWQKKISDADKIIDQNKPWLLEGEKLEKTLGRLVNEIRQITFNLKSFLPGTAEKIEKQFAGPKIKAQKPLFPRLEKTTPEKKTPQKEILIGKVVELSPHPQANKLKLAKIDIGTEKPLTIVCGGPNLKKGQIVPVALPGSKINQPKGGKLKVKKANIRGLKSEGIICSPLEVGRGNNYQEVWELPKETESLIGKPLSVFWAVTKNKKDNAS